MSDFDDNVSELNAPLIAVLGCLGAILTFAIVMLVQVFYYQWEFKDKVAADAANPFVTYAMLKASADARLNEYGWINEDKGVVQIPVRRAMDLVAQEIAAGKYPPVVEVKKDAPAPMPEGTKPAAEAKPAEAKPAETKPAEPAKP